MIKQTDYLKLYQLMSEKEQRSYLERVERWSDDTFPRLLALADSWLKVPVKDFDEGLRLASAMMNARSYIGVANQFEVKRSLTILNGYLSDIRKNTALARMSSRPAEDMRHYRAILPEPGVPQEDGTLKRKEYVAQDVDGRRPEHLHEYIDLLPDSIRKRAEAIDDMYLALAEYRGRVEALADNPNADSSMISEFACKAVNQEQQIRAFWADVDDAYSAAVSNDEHPVPAQKPMLKRPAEYTKEEIDSMMDREQRELCMSKRIEANKKYVRRADMAVTDDYRKELALRIKELMDWGIQPSKGAYIRCEEIKLVVPGFNDNMRDIFADAHAEPEEEPIEEEE